MNNWLPKRIDRYRLDPDPIGEGGFSYVYKARDPKFPNSPLAIKILKSPHQLWPKIHEESPEISAQMWQDIKTKFAAESQLMRNIRGPAIAQIYDTGTFTDKANQEIPFLITDLSESGSLQDRLQSLNRTITKQETSELVDALERILGSLGRKREDYPHGIIHRDIKPSNLLLLKSSGYRPDPKGTLFLEDEELVIADFGLAKPIQPENDGFTGTHGTDLYAAPEQLEHDPSIDTTADIFAATMILAEASLNIRPKSRWLPAQMVFDDAAIKSLGKISSQIEKGLSHDPLQRHQTAKAWGHAFREILSDETSKYIENTSQRVPQSSENQTTWPKSKSMAVITVVAALSLLFIYSFFISDPSREANNQIPLPATATSTSVQELSDKNSIGLEESTTTDTDNLPTTSAKVGSNRPEENVFESTVTSSTEQEELDSIIPSPLGATETCTSKSKFIPFTFWRSNSPHGDGITIANCLEATLETISQVADPEFVNYKYFLAFEQCYFPGGTLQVSDGSSSYTVTSEEDGSCDYQKNIFQANETSQTSVTFTFSPAPASSTFHYRVSSHNG